MQAIEVPNHSMKLTRSVFVFNVALYNIYGFAGWIYVFNRYDTPQERNVAYLKLLLIPDDPNYFSALLMGLIVASLIVILHKSGSVHKVVGYFSLPVLFLSMAWIIWTNL